MTNLLPLTPGLLISMAIRHDHSFGMMLGFFEESTSLEEKQVALLDEVYEEYVQAAQGLPIQSQRLEECTGVGFYQPDREDSYLSSAVPEARLHAEQLVEQYLSTAH